LKANDGDAWRAFAAQLCAFPGHWPMALAAEVLSALRRAAADGVPWHLRATAESLVLRLPSAMLADAAKSWPTDKEGVTGLVELITFRHDALTALTQP
jgi:hypothetical protein